MSVTVKSKSTTRTLVESSDITKSQHWDKDNSGGELPIGYVEAFKNNRIVYFHCYQDLTKNIAANTRVYLGSLPIAFKPARDIYGMRTNSGKINFVVQSDGTTDVEFRASEAMAYGAKLAIDVVYFSAN